ncbi:MAG: hypothetical protein QM647_12390 [Asticcacaulis sp.]|uniref:hypothetical protein n=1 Tax=Asticcacaulis sp. TaxID=1872648 RepID=UPI0039E47760
MAIADTLHGYIDKITDGTLRTTHDLCAADRERLGYLCNETRTGFLQIANTDLPDKTIDDYKPIVMDDGQWEAFRQARLDPFFAETIDLSPGSRQMTPETLIRLSLGRIESQFPGGLETAADAIAAFGDQDVRDLIAAKGLVVYANHIHLHRSRRDNIRKLYRHALVTAAGLLAWTLVITLLGDPLAACGLWALAPVPAVLVLSVAAFHIRSVLIRRRHNALADQFNAATRLSCATVSKCAILRQDHLIHACHAMLELTNSGKEDYWAEGRLRRWTEVNAKWCELIFWLNGRIAANAAFAFLRAKMIGMTLEGLTAQARFLALKMTAGALAALGLMALAGLGLLFVSLWQNILPIPALGLLMGCVYLGWQTLRLHALLRPGEPPQAVNEILHGDSLQRMKSDKDARLHEDMARFMKREKLKQLYAERTRLYSGVTQDLGQETVMT